MEEERERTIDRFDLVRTYQNAESKEDFLYMLLNLEAVQAQSSMVSYIREVLHCMKQYARQHTLAVIKGIVSSVFPGKKENSGEVYERWEDTPEFAEQMDSLWRALGIDYEVYNNQTRSYRTRNRYVPLMNEAYRRMRARDLSDKRTAGKMAALKEKSRKRRKRSQNRGIR